MAEQWTATVAFLRDMAATGVMQDTERTILKAAANIVAKIVKRENAHKDNRHAMEALPGSEASTELETTDNGGTYGNV